MSGPTRVIGEGTSLAQGVVGPAVSLLLPIVGLMFLERRCPGCNRRARFVCEACFGLFQQSGPVQLEGLESVWSAFDYNESVARAVLAAKNGGRRDVLRRLSQPLVSALAAVDAAEVDVVTWVPASPENRRRRGYDQGRLLARLVADRTHVVDRLLVRRGSQQKGRDRQARLDGVSLWATGPACGRVLVVDDVVTTGASLRAAALALTKAGADSVSAMTIASTGWPAPDRE